MGKNVSFIIPHIGKGGAERVVTNLANQLCIDGYTVKIYTILSDEEKYKLLDGVEHIHLGVNCSNKILRMILRFSRLRKLIKNDTAETIIAFDRYYGICSSIGTGKRVVGSERNDPYSNMPKYSLQKYFRDWLYGKVDFMVFQTQYAKEYFNEKIQEHSTIIPNPVSTDFLPQPFDGNRTKEIVTACRLTEQKNLPMMIQAFLQFDKKHPGYKLVIYGEGNLKNKIQDMINQHNVSEKIVLAGYAENLPYKIYNAAMYVSSSNYEGISNSMLEALAMGLPTVCTDCPAGGAAMVIKDGVNGKLVPVKDVEAMAEAMCSIIEDEDKTREMSATAVQVRENYSISKIIKRWEEVI